MRTTLALTLCVLVAQSDAADNVQDLLKQLMKEKSPKEIDALMAGLSKPASVPAPALPIKVASTAVSAVASVVTAPVKVAAAVVKAVVAPAAPVAATTAAPAAQVAPTAAAKLQAKVQAQLQAAAAPVAKPAAAVAKPAAAAVTPAAVVVAKPAAAVPAVATPADADAEMLASVPAVATPADAEKQLKESISKLSPDDILATLNSVTTAAPAAAPVAKESTADAKAKLKELLKQKSPDQLKALKLKLQSKKPKEKAGAAAATVAPKLQSKKPKAMLNKPKHGKHAKPAAAFKVEIDPNAMQGDQDQYYYPQQDDGYGSGDQMELQMDPFRPNGGQGDVVEMIQMDINERGAPVMKEIMIEPDPFSRSQFEKNPAKEIAGLMNFANHHHGNPTRDGAGNPLLAYPMDPDNANENLDDIAKDVSRRHKARAGENYSMLHNVVLMVLGVGAVYLVLSGKSPVAIPGFGNVNASQVYRQSSNKMEDVFDDFGLPMDGSGHRGFAKPLRPVAGGDDYGGLL